MRLLHDSPVALTRLTYMTVPIYLREFESCGLTERVETGGYKITLRPRMEPGIALDTLIHECIHVIDLYNEINLEHDHEAPESSGTHRVVQQLASGLAQMLSELRVVRAPERGKSARGSRAVGSRGRTSRACGPVDGVAQFLEMYGKV